MKTYIFFSLGITAALMLAVVASVPVYAQSAPTGGVTLVSPVSGTAADAAMIMPVVHGHHGGFRAFRGGFGGYWPGYYGYGYYGGSYPGYSDGYGYYNEGNQVCVWNGYNYQCYNAYGTYDNIY
ncbi:MAG TPA: hypothetical protein VK463_06505 [Desulfomonilaceae bacterium]|nr:hypothetical protein [Desulfomonilaceae bacterium]